jgi:hypothetical protein
MLGWRGWVVVLALAASAGAAAAEPEWVTDLREKADDYERRLREALDRLKAAARDAGNKLAADAKARLAELIALLEANLHAAERVLAEQGHEYAVVVHARLREATEVADQLGRELGEVIAGTRTQLDVDRRRLVTGARQIVDESLREAGRQLASAELVDDRVVARAVEQTTASAKRWLGVAVAGGGVVVIGLGVGLLWQRRRPRWRWLLTAAGAIAIVGGGIAVVLGLRHWLAAPDATVFTAGISRCEALADAQRLIDSHHTGPARPAVIAALERCQLLVADTGAAELVADRLARIRSLPD